MLGGGGGGHRTIATVLTARDEATSELNSVEESGNQTAESMEQAESSTQGLTRSFAILGGAATALTGSLGALVHAHGSTEQTLARLEVVTGATQQQMEGLRRTAVGLGTDLPVSIGQASDALEQLAFAGFEVEEAMAAADGVANLAVASVMNVGQSARAASSALRMFGMEANEAHQVTASMAAVFSESATNMQELNSVIERAGPIADTAGVNLNELAGAAGVLADQGIRASRAGTALENTIRNIATGSGQAEEALSELGLSLDDLTDEQGEMRDLTTVFQTLDGEMQGLDGRADRLAVATELAGQRGARALLPLLDNADKLNEKLGAQFRSEVQESIGQLATLSEDEIQGVETALDGMEIDPDEVTPQELFNRFEQFADDGESVDEVATRIEASLNVSGEAAEYFAEGLVSGEASAEQFAEQIGEATTASELAASQMDTTAGMVEFLRSSVDAFTFSVHAGASPAIKSFNGLLASGINVINEHRAIGAAAGTAMVALAGATGLAAAGLGAHIVQLKIANLQLSAYTGNTLASTAALKAKTVALGAASKAKWAMTASTSTLAGALMTEVNITRANIAAKLSGASAAGVLTAAKGALTAAAFGAAAGITAVWSALGPIGLLAVGVTAAILGLVGVMRTDLFGAGDAAGSILGFFGDKARTAGAAARELIGIVYELGRIGATLGGMALLAPFAAILRLPDLVRSVGPEAKQAAMNLPSQILEGLDSLGPAQYALPVLGPLLLARDIITDPTGWIEAGKQIPSAIVSGIGSRATAPVERITGIGPDIRDAAANLPGAVVEGLDRLGPAAYAIPVIGPLWGIYERIDGLGPTVREAAANLPSKIVEGLGSLGPARYALPIIGPLLAARDMATDPGRWIEAGKQIPSTIASGITNFADAPVDSVRNMVGRIRSFLPFSPADVGPLTDIDTSGASLPLTIANGILDAGDPVREALASVLPVPAEELDLRTWVRRARDLPNLIGRGILRGPAITSYLRDKVQDGVDFLTSPSRWKEAGSSLTSEIASGISSTASDVTDAVEGVASGARDRLPFSPARIGPLSDLDETGPSLISTIAGGVEGEESTLMSSMTEVLSATPLGEGAEAAGNMLQMSPLGQVAGPVGAGAPAQAPQQSSRRPVRVEIKEINQDIEVHGDADEETAQAVGEEAEDGITSGVDSFMEELSRELD